MAVWKCRVRRKWLTHGAEVHWDVFLSRCGSALAGWSSAFVRIPMVSLALSLSFAAGTRRCSRRRRAVACRIITLCFWPRDIRPPCVSFPRRRGKVGPPLLGPAVPAISESPPIRVIWVGTIPPECFFLAISCILRVWSLMWQCRLPWRIGG